MPKHKQLSIFLILILGIMVISSPVARASDTTAQSYQDLDSLKKEIPDKLDLGNQNIADTAMTMAAEYPGEYNINQVCEIYNALAGRNGWFYFSDPANKNRYQNANLTLQMGKKENTVGLGDCNDFAILMASLIQSIGGSTRILFAFDNQNKTGHAYTELYLGDKGDPLVNSTLHWLEREYYPQKIVGFDYSGNETWLKPRLGYGHN